MKKTTLFTAVAVMALAGPLAIGAASAQQGQGRYEGPSQQAENQDARDSDRNARSEDRDHRDRRETWREDRRDQRWDDARYNGYYDNDRWFYGPPPEDRYRRSGFALGYRPWSAGQYLGYYNGRFQDVDYRRSNLRRPMRGARWVRDDRGDYLLVTRNGRIMQVVVSGHQPRDRRQSWRDDRADARWDNGRHNGHYRDNRWTFGPPSGSMQGVTFGYQPWQRGERLGYYNGRYSEVDYRSNRSLRAPSRGEHWVRNDGGDYLLVAIATGVILQVILNNSR